MEIKNEELTDMKDQELRDILHAYRPEIDDNDAFMDKLSAQMDAVDAKQQRPRVQPLYRRVLPWVTSIAAVVIIAFVMMNPFASSEEGIAPLSEQQLYAKLYPSQQERGWREESSSSFEETVAEIEQSGQQLQLAIAEMQK